MKRHGGYTLIELLIVIALISMLASGSMYALLGPLQEQRAADVHSAATRGANAVLAALVADLHGAKRIAEIDGGATIEGSLTTVSYAVDTSGTLRRSVDAATTGAALLSDVREFSVLPSSDGRMAVVTLRAGAEEIPGRRIVDREFSIVMGHGWMGEVSR